MRLFSRCFLWGGGILSCKNDDEESDVKVTGITLNAAEGATTVVVGAELQITAVITPENATNKAIEWSSSDASKATVDQTGKVTGVAKTGENEKVTITATAKDGSKVLGTFEIQVKDAGDNTGDEQNTSDPNNPNAGDNPDTSDPENPDTSDPNNPNDPDNPNAGGNPDTSDPENPDQGGSTTPVTVNATWDFSNNRDSSVDGINTNDTEVSSAIELTTNKTGSSATLTVSGGKCKWNGGLQFSKGSNTGFNAKGILTLVLSGKAKVSITADPTGSSNADQVDRTVYLAKEDDTENALIKWDGFADASGETKTTENALDAGTYKIYVNGSRIKKIECTAAN